MPRAWQTTRTSKKAMKDFLDQCTDDRGMVDTAKLASLMLRRPPGSVSRAHKITVVRRRSEQTLEKWRTNKSIPE